MRRRKNALCFRLGAGGFSLGEVVLAMGLFAIGAVAVTGTLVYGYRNSVNAVYESTAHAVAQGYVEQIMAVDFDVIYEAYEGRDDDPPAELILKALSPSQVAASSVELDDPLDFSGTARVKNVVIDLRDDGHGGVREVLMPMRVRLTANDLTASASPLSALEITLEYEFLSPVTRGQSWSHDQLSFVKSNVPIY